MGFGSLELLAFWAAIADVRVLGTHANFHTTHVPAMARGSPSRRLHRQHLGAISKNAVRELSISRVTTLLAHDVFELPLAHVVEGSCGQDLQRAGVGERHELEARTEQVVQLSESGGAGGGCRR